MSSVRDVQAPPNAFRQHNQNENQRTVRLTQQAIGKLETDHQIVTLEAVSKATREFDDRGKGIRSVTILRNAEAAALFRQHSPAYQKQQAKARAAKRKRSKAKGSLETRAMYRGLHSSELIQMVEDLKQQVIEMKAQQDKLRIERDEAYRLRNEVLQQNTRQLATLTNQTQALDKKR